MFTELNILYYLHLLMPSVTLSLEGKGILKQLLLKTQSLDFSIHYTDKSDRHPMYSLAMS